MFNLFVYLFVSCLFNLFVSCLFNLFVYLFVSCLFNLFVSCLNHMGTNRGEVGIPWVFGYLRQGQDPFPSPYPFPFYQFLSYSYPYPLLPTFFIPPSLRFHFFLYNSISLFTSIKQFIAYFFNTNQSVRAVTISFLSNQQFPFPLAPILFPFPSSVHNQFLLFESIPFLNQVSFINSS